jgi:hypothetical protein
MMPSGRSVTGRSVRKEGGVDWVSYFVENGQQREQIRWEPIIEFEPRVRCALVQSLQRFQVGERGDGAHLLAVARAAGDARYLAALELFIQEEQVHAGLLAQAIRALGGETVAAHWSDRCFVWLRRAAGLRTELFVLLTAELIGLRYYRALRDGLADPLLHALFTQIVRDEEAHLAFHYESLQRLLADHGVLARRGVGTAWTAFFRVVCAVVLLDHGPALSAVGVTPGAFLKSCAELQAQAQDHIFATAAEAPRCERSGGDWASPAAAGEVR